MVKSDRKSKLRGAVVIMEVLVFLVEAVFKSTAFHGQGDTS